MAIRELARRLNRDVRAVHSDVHALHVVLVQPHLSSDLTVGQVQPLQVQAQNPRPRRLIVTGKDRLAHVIKVTMIPLAGVLLPM